jgi:BirA family biotin operon repressor/biotin-[acetyl-CoA-carboxylase] ligase
LEIVYLDQVESTHSYLKNYLKQNNYVDDIAIVTNHQTNGIGSKNNTWDGKRGNLFFSFSLKKDKLPNDLPLQSASIYLSFLLKLVLQEFGSKLVVKWPNDFYIENKKIGGTITTLTNDTLLCGIGLNLEFVDERYGSLDIKIDQKKVLETYFSVIKQKLSWKNIFSKFQIEFYDNNSFETIVNDKKILLKDQELQEDGSLVIDGEKVFSLR